MKTGNPTTNPGVVVVPQSNGLFGALMTSGEHKGFGMAMACELLGGALTGGGTWHREADDKRAVLERHADDDHRPCSPGSPRQF
jgi:uncharacterized oxidoreductase